MLTFLILMATASPCHGAPPAVCIATAEEDYAALRYDTAAARAETLLAADALPLDVVIRAHFVLGRVDAIAGRDARAEEHFLSLLVLDPQRRLGEGASPKIRAPFARAQKRAEAERARTDHDATTGPTSADPSPAPPVPDISSTRSERPTNRTNNAAEYAAEDEAESDTSAFLVPALIGGAAAAIIIGVAVGAGMAATAWFLTRPAECDASLGCVDAP